MSNELDKEVNRLSQAQRLDRLKREVSATEMIVVYFSEHQPRHRIGIHCALIPSEKLEECLARPTWNLMHGDGLPGTCEYNAANGERCVEYLRYGSRDSEPLVVDRVFYGIRRDYIELSEEFRFFHRLYHDREQDHFLKIEDDGSETLVATIEPKHVQVRAKELRQFLAVKEMHLAIQFDSREHSLHSLEELGLEMGGGEHREDLLCWGLHRGHFNSRVGGFKSFSRLFGKRLIPPFPKEKSGFWGFAREDRKKHEEFIIKVDEDGNEQTYTSDPDALADYFGRNRGAPHYLTPVHFRKSVLDKYYQQAAKYSVEDSILRCGYLWSLSIDNHHEDRVCAWLGDLGRDLPHAEQLHWRSQNIPPAGEVSETYRRRQTLNQWAETDRPELLFHEQYHKLSRACTQFLGWQLLLPLSDADLHCLQGLRVPATDDQREFDEVVLGLTKVIIDSLNEEMLKGLTPPSTSSNTKGSIARLEAVFVACGAEGFEEHIEFLRTLQNLRSSGSAHRKGGAYRTVAKHVSVHGKSLRAVVDKILRQGVSLLEYMIKAVASGKLVGSDGPSLPPVESA